MESLELQLRAVGSALGLPITDVQVAGLLDYLALLQRWNSTYNLTAVRDPAAMLFQHLADCLAIIKPLTNYRQTPGTRVIDVGSGGGLPGVVLAIMLPLFDVTCVDAVGKKAAFVRQVAAELHLPNLHSRHGRVEQLRAAPFDVITSRAFASLSQFLRSTEQLLSAEGCWIAMKGKVPVDEMSALDSSVDVFHVEHIAVPGLTAERCLVWARRRTPADANL